MSLLKLALLLVLLIPTQLAAAQHTETPLEPNARALLFQVQSNVAVSAFSGATLSMKWHSESDRARRLGVTVDGHLAFADDRSRQRAMLEGHFLWLQYRDSRTRAYLYHGFGPTAEIRFTRQETNVESLNILEGSVGAGGVLGVEWFATRSIGILAEYHGAVLVTVRRQRRPGIDDLNEYGLGIDSRGVRAGISVYF